MKPSSYWDTSMASHGHGQPIGEIPLLAHPGAWSEAISALISPLPKFMAIRACRRGKVPTISHLFLDVSFRQNVPPLPTSTSLNHRSAARAARCWWPVLVPIWATAPLPWKSRSWSSQTRTKPSLPPVLGTAETTDCFGGVKKNL